MEPDGEQDPDPPAPGPWGPPRAAGLGPVVGVLAMTPGVPSGDQPVGPFVLDEGDERARSPAGARWAWGSGCRRGRGCSSTAVPPARRARVPTVRDPSVTVHGFSIAAPGGPRRRPLSAMMSTRKPEPGPGGSGRGSPRPTPTPDPTTRGQTMEARITDGDRSAMVRAAVTRVDTNELKTALDLTASPAFQVPKAVANALNALRKHRDPAGVVDQAAVPCRPPLRWPPPWPTSVCPGPSKCSATTRTTRPGSSCSTPSTRSATRFRRRRSRSCWPPWPTTTCPPPISVSRSWPATRGTG